MKRPLRLLTLGRSYVVGANRALARSLAEAGGDRWSVTCAAPERYPGDLRPHRLEPQPGERVTGLGVHGAWSAHAMVYGTELRALLRAGWDVVHCWEEPFVAAAAQVAAWTPRGARLVFATFQNLPKRYPPPFSWGERYALRRAAGWIAFGATVAEALEGRAGYAARPHRVIAPGVDTRRFRPDPVAGRATLRSLGWDAEGPPVVGFLGRFVPEKGLTTLMDALDGCRRPWRALMVGGGPLEPRLRRWAAAHPERVRVVTDAAHDAVPRHLQAMALLCAPSRATPRWREQFGRMLVEAMASGVPVLGGDSGEIPHVVAGAGTVLPPENAAAWSAALDDLLADPVRRDELAAAGRARVDATFALPVVARRHLAFFDELIA